MSKTGGALAEARIPAHEKEQMLKHIRDANSYMGTQFPDFAMISTFCPWRIVDADIIAATCGRYIYFGKSFFYKEDENGNRTQAYTSQQHLAILLHEVLHIAFRHAQRAKRICHTRSDYELFNWAADCLINESIRNQRWLSLPEECLFFEKVFTTEECEKLKPYSKLRVEDVFHLLQKKAEQLAEQLGKSLEEALDKLRDSSGAGSGINKDLLDPVLGKALEELAKKQGKGMGEHSDPESDLDDDIWARRLRGLQAGTGTAAEIFKGLDGDFPESTVPWRQLLMQLVKPQFVRQLLTNWNRPSRRASAYQKGIFMPATTRRPGIDTLVIGWDTSGSCYSKEFVSLVAPEVEAIQTATGCDLLILFVDTCIVDVIKVDNDGRPLTEKVLSGEISIKGGGGTDFCCLFENEWKVGEDGEGGLYRKPSSIRAMIVFTDAYGEIPEQAPPYPVIWAGPKGGMDVERVKRHFGHLVEITNY